jgi:predicted short-subunit dehydrogenase-like oxidoreductase (DUF2520 family)
MGQVPKTSKAEGASSTANLLNRISDSKSIGILGDGRLAKNLQHWLQLKGVRPSLASRRDFAFLREENWTEYLARSFSTCKVVVVAVSDVALEEVVRDLRRVFSGAIVHCSGAKFFAGASTWHPLCTFTERMLTVEQYDSIHFVGTRESLPFAEVFPAFANAHSYIEKEQLPLYHALCVLAGNFSTLLWSTLAKGFEAELKLSSTVAIPYLQAVARNIELGLEESNVEKYLTGPISRGDATTIESNLAALQNKPAATIYRAFVDVFSKQKGSVP